MMSIPGVSLGPNQQQHLPASVNGLASKVYACPSKSLGTESVGGVCGDRIFIVLVFGLGLDLNIYCGFQV